MEKESIVIATVTWARDEEEESLLRISLTLLAKTGVTVYITDGGSNASFLQFLHAFPQFKVYQSERKGLWAQVSNSLEKAYEAGTPFIFYTEPDKRDFFLKEFASFLRDSPKADNAGIVTASRSAESFSSFPAFQQMTETSINNCCTEVTGIKTDYTYGPFLMNRLLVTYLNVVNEDIGWGWRPFVFCLASRLGYPIESVTGDFFCPTDQQEDSAEERIYRMKQLQQNILGILLGASVNVDASL